MLRSVHKGCLAATPALSTLTTIVVSGQEELFLFGYHFLFKRRVSFQRRSVRAYDSVDPAHQAGSRCTPLDQMRLACQSCGQMRSDLVIEAAATIRSCSSFAVVGVVSGSQNQPAAGVHEDGRWAACGLQVQLAVGVSEVAVDLVLRAYDHSTVPNLSCHSSA
jgi:hypothetical protein